MAIGKIFTKLFSFGAKATKVASRTRVNPKHKIISGNPKAVKARGMLNVNPKLAKEVRGLVDEWGYTTINLVDHNKAKCIVNNTGNPVVDFIKQSGYTENTLADLMNKLNKLA